MRWRIGCGIVFAVRGIRRFESVLVERVDGECGGGHTEGFLNCIVYGSGLRAGELVKVRVTDAENGNLLAVPVADEGEGS